MSQRLLEEIQSNLAAINENSTLKYNDNYKLGDVVFQNSTIGKVIFQKNEHGVRYRLENVLTSNILDTFGNSITIYFTRNFSEFEFKAISAIVKKIKKNRSRIISKYVVGELIENKSDSNEKRDIVESVVISDIVFHNIEKLILTFFYGEYDVYVELKMSSDLKLMSIDSFM